MISVDIKSLINRLNPLCTQALEGAAGLCVARTHYEVTLEHLLAKLLEHPQADIPLILRAFDRDPTRLLRAVERAVEDYRTGNAARPVFSPLLMELFQEAWLIASVDLDAPAVRSGALLLALLTNPTRFLAGEVADLLADLSRDALRARFGTLVAGSVEQDLPGRGRPAQEEVPGAPGALGRYCIDFTRKAADGEIDPVFGRDNEIRQMIDILARRRKNNPIVVGEPGVGKTAVVEGLALRVVEGDVPELLQGVSILGLDMGLLQAGAGVKGEFENRLKSVISEITASEKPIILFIDEAHTLIGAGGAAGGSDAANLLKPALARGELRTVAATTWSEYKKYFEKDAALARRFQLVKLDEPSVETAVLILRGLKTKYEQAHGVVVRDDAIAAAAELSSRYLSGRQLPDKAVDLLDTSAARVKVLLSGKPAVIEDMERRRQALAREQEALTRDRLHGVAGDDERPQAIREELGVLEEDLAAQTERWRSEQSLAHEVIALRGELAAAPDDPADLSERLASAGERLVALQGDQPLVKTEVDPDVVAKVVSDWTGIPLGKVMREEARTVMGLEDSLRTRIKGQEPALEILTQVIRAGKAGLKDPAQPLGVFLLVGPSGVGKTETGLAVADLLFGGERFMVTVNMSEFQERHTVSRLIGSPPGYVGYGEGGVLTEALRQRPYSVVLLDEVEKAHLEVMNLFYQVFDKGTLSDGEGRLIDCRNTVILLTSNLATDVITELCAGGERPPYTTLVEAIRPILSSHFKPALLARMTVVPFFTLPPEILTDIVVLKLDKLKQRMAETHRIRLDYTPAVVAAIGARCTEVETGARNIDHILSGTILPRLSREILMRMGEGEMPARVQLDVERDQSFSFTFGAA